MLRCQPSVSSISYSLYNALSMAITNQYFCLFTFGGTNVFYLTANTNFYNYKKFSKVDDYG